MDGFDGGVTEVTEQSYCERMQNACAGVCIGLLLFFGSWGVLFWNEGRAVKRQQDLDEGRGIVVQLGLTTPNATIDKSQDNNLVYVYGTVDGGNANIYDEEFNLNVTNATMALKYNRRVEMYQVQERSETRTEKTSAGGTRQVTEYSYDQVWTSSLINSDNFKQAVPVGNPKSFLVNPLSVSSEDIGLGAYSLSSDILSQINWWTAWTDAPINATTLDFGKNFTASYSGGQLELLQNPSTFTIGDTRVSFSVVLPEDVSVVAKQDPSGKLVPHITEGDRELYLFSRGIQTSDELFQQAEDDNVTLTWILRFVGFLCMVVGVCLILNPIATAFDVLPFCGDALEGCIGGCIIPCIALCISIPLSLLIISIAWIFYRPIFAIGTLLMLGILGFFFYKYIKPKMAENSPAGKPENQQAPAPAAYGEPQKYNEQEAEIAPGSSNAQPFSMALDAPPPSVPAQTYGGNGGYNAP